MERALGTTAKLRRGAYTHPLTHAALDAHGYMPLSFGFSYQSWLVGHAS